MTREEAIAYFIDSNERIISVAKDENRYNYETQQIEDVFMRKDFEAKDIAIKALEQEPKSGHWITEIKSDLRGDMWPTNPKCSVCGGEPYYSNTIYNYKFCPYCGAKMEEEEC